MKIAMNPLLHACIALAGAVCLAQASWAEERGREGFHGEWHGGWHEGGRGDWHEWHGDWHGPHFGVGVRLFDDHDWGLWRGGHWAHVDHDGRLGWWWVAGGLWYFYPAPVYPYPDPYAPPEVAVVTQPQQPVGASLPPQPKSWYHCNSPDGYYPYVSTCPGGWQAVAATPAQPATASAPQ